MHLFLCTVYLCLFQSFLMWPQRERKRKDCDYSRSINLNHKILPFYIKVCFTPNFLRVCICSLPLLRLTDNCTCPQNVRIKAELDTWYIYTGKQGQRCRNKFNLFDIATSGWTILTRNVFSFRPLQIHHYNSSRNWMKISYKIYGTWKILPRSQFFFLITMVFAFRWNKVNYQTWMMCYILQLRKLSLEI